jgi:hypothetical protein
MRVSLRRAMPLRYGVSRRDAHGAGMTKLL